MIEFKRIDHILLSFPEGKRTEAKDFYGRLLGLEEIPGQHPRGAIWYRMGNIELHLREENVSNASLRHPAFEVADLKSAKQYLEENGVKIYLSSKIEGRERIFILDPFDNRIELIGFD